MVLVLLLGEIDLSVGAVSGLCAAVMAVLNVKHGWVAGPGDRRRRSPCGAAIGMFQGFISTQVRDPVASSSRWPACSAGRARSSRCSATPAPSTSTAGASPTWPARSSSDAVGWIVAIAAIAAYAAWPSSGRQRRVRAGLSAPSTALLAIRIGAVAVAALVAVWVVNKDRGVPLAVLILVGFVAAFDFMTRRTRFGRHIYAVGGNAEAARRAGIHVFRVRVVVFALCSTMAAIGGIMAASRLLAVNQSSGGSDLLLLSIAGPVIAGTSLFGGRGSVWSALLGALVIGSISNGMDLLALRLVDQVHGHRRRAAGRRGPRCRLAAGPPAVRAHVALSCPKREPEGRVAARPPALLRSARNTRGQTRCVAQHEGSDPLRCAQRNGSDPRCCGCGRLRYRAG